MIQSLYEPFKKWSEQGSVWLISDPHFDDLDCKLMNENWITPEEHINILNKNIHKNDTLVCLGDCGNLERFKELKCQNLILIKGNHDDKGNSRYTPYFKEIYSGALFISSQILLSHEPVYGLKFCCNIHGHEHNGVQDYTDREGGKHLNIASDVIQWQPINLGKLIKCGLIAELPTIHRITIDKAIENSICEGKDKFMYDKELKELLSINYRELEELNKKYLDTLDLDEYISTSNDVYTIIDMIENDYDYSDDLPEELAGSIFEYLGTEEIAYYLADRYGKHVDKEIVYRYTLYK